MADVAENLPAKTHPMVAMREFLDRRIGEIKTALPAHMSPERFVRVVMTAIQLNPDLLACDRASLWNSCMRAANDGLIPDGREGAIVPFKGKAQWLPMYQGLLKKFRNSGEFKWVTAGIVYEGETYEHWIDETGEHFKHVPGDDIEGKKIRRVYALATTKDGGSFIADLPLADINKRRAMSRATREDSPWKQWPGEMMKKSALRVLSRLLPMSSDLDALIQRDEQALLGVEALEERRQATAVPSGVGTTTSALDHFAREDKFSGTQQPVEGSEGAGDGGAGDASPSDTEGESAARTTPVAEGEEGQARTANQLLSLEDHAREVAKKGERAFLAFVAERSPAEKRRINAIAEELRNLMNEADEAK